MEPLDIEPLDMEPDIDPEAALPCFFAGFCAMWPFDMEPCDIDPELIAPPDMEPDDIAPELMAPPCMDPVWAPAPDDMEPLSCPCA